MVSYGGGGDNQTAKLGLAAAPFPEEMINNIGLPMSGGFIIAALVRPISTHITKLGLILGTAGVTPNGVNAMALLDAAGNFIDRTADMSTAWSTAGNNGLYLSSALTLGTTALSTSANYYVATLGHMVTPPNIAGFFAGGGVAYPTVLGNKPVIADGGHTDFPSQLNIAGAAGGNGGYWLVGEP